MTTQVESDVKVLPPPAADKLIEKSVKDVMEQSFIDYAMSVITGRALPDVRDGLKPVHRRILYAMHESNNDWNKAYKKSARMVGDVIGKYHPHGDTSVYNAAVRMAQSFSMLKPLIDGQGNFGSIDGDAPAAMRYTEMRLARLSGEMFTDLHKETINWNENYDGTEKEPEVLTVPYPNLLINGGEGIAVGMASSIPPHNLKDVIDTTQALMKNPALTFADVSGLLKAPDFPTRGLVFGLDGFYSAVESGSGSIRLRAKYHVEDRKKGGSVLVIDELPYQVNKAKLVSRIAELVRNKEIEDVVALRDESNKEGIRVVLEVKTGGSADSIFAQLTGLTELETSVSYNCVVIDNGIPKQLGLKSMIIKWIEFRRDTVLKRYIFERGQVLAKLHILNGYIAAISQLDAVINLIRTAKNAEDARTGLMLLLTLDQAQAQAVLDLRLQKLTGMELDGVQNDFNTAQAKISELTAIIESPSKIDEIITEELDAIKTRYGTDRNTEIGYGIEAVTREDMIPQEDILIVLTKNGYIKRTSADGMSVQNKGTRGKKALEIGDSDEVLALYKAHTHDLILIFDEEGQTFALKGYRIPEASANSKGRHIKNVVEGLDKEISAVVQVPTNTEGYSIVVVTDDAQVKRSSISEYINATRKGGIRGVTLNNNKVVGVFVMKDTDDLMLMSDNCNSIRFNLSDLREIGRTGQGVMGMRLEDNARIIGAHAISAEDSADKFIVCLGANGVGKKTPVADFPVQNRAGKGLAVFKESAKTGKLVAAFGASNADDVVLLTSKGVSNRVHISAINETGRATSGVYLINVDEGHTLISATTVVRTESATPDEPEVVAQVPTAQEQA